MGLSFWLLVLAQGLYTVNNVVLIAISALAGLALAPDARLATLPATATVLGSALSTGLVARLQRAHGRKRGFQAGLGLGVLAFGLCALAVLRQDFWLLTLGSLLAGFHGASGSLYRFAATELVAPGLRERALSLILVGGLLGAVAGPWLAGHGEALAPAPFVGAYAAISLVSLLALGTLSLIHFPSLGTAATAQGRRVRELARQPAFVAALLGGALGFGVMNLLMTATPIAMQQHDHAFHHGTMVLQWHVVAMFAPSFFSGRLIQWWGPRRVMALGLALNGLCVAVALSGVDLMRFTTALVALGLGWNLLYTGASALLLTTYEPEERTTAQAAMDFWTFATLACSSLLSGVLVTGPGWQSLNLAALLPLGFLALALLWSRKRPAA